MKRSDGVTLVPRSRGRPLVWDISVYLGHFWHRVLRSPILGVMGVLRGRDCTNRKPTHDFTIALNTKFCSICRRFSGIPMKNYAPPQFDPLPEYWLRVDVRGPNGTNRNVVPTFLFDFKTHYRPNLHRLATIHNAADIQTTDRAIGVGRLCYSIDGSKWASAAIHLESWRRS